MKLNWRKIFDWSIDCVGGPGQVFYGNGNVRGYIVIVRYVHHGSEEFFFAQDDERLWAQYGSPEAAAKQTAKLYREKLAKQKSKVASAHQK